MNVVCRFRRFGVLAAAMLGLLLSAVNSPAVPRSPFGIKVLLMPGSTNQTVGVEVVVPPESVLYSERLHFQTSDGDDLTPSKIPEPLNEIDKATGKEKKVYDQSFHAELPRASLVNGELVIKFQGCSNANCFFPEKRTFKLGSAAAPGTIFTEEMPPPEKPEYEVFDWAAQMHGFTVTGQQSGYLAAGKFISFLDGQAQEDYLTGWIQKYGLSITLALIVFFGAAMNLTPCILPMIPINLAIIGAGHAASSRFAGFKNGAVYGLGMALAYGVLGLAVVLTGSKFGTINSSVWFNVLVAAVFVILGLGMFDVVNIDLSRFGGGIGPQKAHPHRGSLIRNGIILTMGVMSALLAGACVAPIVISVILLAATLYAKKQMAGLLLPFLLGIGMAAPWPLAGAGLTFLPKPGRWMNRVKHAFGVLIFAFAIYYGHLAVNAYESRQDSTLLASSPPGESGVKNDPNVVLAAALQQARDSGKPVLVDFHASWCKNCLAMDETVFSRAEVKKRLSDFVIVRYDAERPNQSPAREVLNHFSIMGLPAYIVLTPAKANN